MDLKAKIVLKTTDELWERLREKHRIKYPKDANNMNVAVNRAMEEFIRK